MASGWRVLAGGSLGGAFASFQESDIERSLASDVVTLTHVTRPSTTADGLHASDPAFGDPRVMALLASLVRFSHVLIGFINRELVELVASLLDQPYSIRRATYHLRRLRRKALITRLPTHTATSSPLSADAPLSCSPRPMAGCSLPASHS